MSFDNVFEYFDGDIRKCVVVIALDASGSMSSKEEIVYNATVELLKMMAKQNETNVDSEFRVILMLFNNDVKVINTDYVPLPPEQMLELLERKDYSCSGGTSLAAVFNKVDQMFSRKDSGLLNKAQQGDPYPLVIYISDIVPTDSAESYEKAKNALLSNRFYTHTNRLCVFVGPSAKKSAAAELVGGEDNVLALDTNLEGLLAPVIMGSSIIASDATHIGNETQSPGEVAKEQQERAEAGQESADTLTDKELQEELNRLFKGV